MIQLSNHNPSINQMIPMMIDGVHERADRRPQQHQPEDQGDDADDRGVHAQRLGQAFDKIAAGATHQLEQTAEAVNDETDDCPE